MDGNSVFYWIFTGFFPSFSKEKHYLLYLYFFRKRKIYKTDSIKNPVKKMDENPVK
jgi:hypothetical protein|tara:strand:+ start:358 stop:525 length:168 start_codon:yes stop_codon:yes gene_type:complete